MMGWLFESVDIYCERVSPDAWNEPINTVTNIAFLVAVGYLCELYKEQNRKDHESCMLILLIGLVGIGSFAFHIYGNNLTLLMDVVPIGIFVFYYLWVVFKRFLHWSRNKILVSLGLFAAVEYLVSMIPPPNFNGSLSYFPCLLAIVFIGRELQKRRCVVEAEYFFKAGAWFAVSLSFRILDNAICSLLPMGTHFAWHICNSMVLYTLVNAVIHKPAVTLK